MSESKKSDLRIEINLRKPCGLDWAQASWTRWIHVLSWCWLNPILNKGFKQGLTDDDLFDLSPNDEGNQLLNKFESVLEEHNNDVKNFNVWKIVLKSFWKEAIIAGLILIPYLGAKIAQPLLLREIILYISDANQPRYSGYIYAIGLGLAAILQAIIHQQFFFRTIRVGVQIRVSISTFIYKRLLLLKSKDIMRITTGQIINLISNDVGKLQDLTHHMHYLWEAPLEAIIAFGLIWNRIGIPTLFGYAVLLLLAPLQLFFSKKFAEYKKSTVRCSDQRVKLVNELLTGCQIVKMYGWEKALEKIVFDARKKECKNIQRAGRIRAINMSTFFFSLPLLSLATFGGSWLMGRKLSAVDIFPVLSLFGIIRAPITNYLPYAIERLSESIVASKRINDFVNSVRENVLSNSSEAPDNDDCDKPGTIIMKKASFTWGSTQSNELKAIDFNVKSGSLISIIGSIGSCKSSLLAAVLGEMMLTEGSSKVNGKCSYVSQIPWIFIGTLRDNILFGKPFDKEKYKRVLKACCLFADLHILPAGDLTMIGENGVNLSGGQKARVSLARAVYTEADIYLFDDPLAAVDHAVAQAIFQQCMGNDGILKNKTRLLVTHQIQFLSEVDYCILLDNGNIEKKGSFDDLLEIEHMKQSYEQQKHHIDKIKRRNAQIHCNTESEHNEEQDDDLIFNQTKSSDQNSIVKGEKSNRGGISGKIWINFFTFGYGWIGLILLIFLMILGEGIYDTTNKWLSIWSSKPEVEQRKSLYIYIYLGLVIGTSTIAILRAQYFFQLVLRSASVIHNNMFRGVLYTSLRFHESNPAGRILNRFSKDQQIMDELLPLTFFDALQSLTMVLGSIVIIGIANPWVLLVLIPIVPAFIWLRRFYLRTSREVKRLESMTRSPIYALFSSSLTGLVTIRASKMHEYFLNLFIDKLNENTRALFIFICSVRWFGLRLDLMACLITFSTAILSVSLRNNMDPSSVAIGLTYCINLTALFQWGVRQMTETENYMTSVERIDEYSALPPEPDFNNDDLKPLENWPIDGKIEFRNFQFKYVDKLEPVLKGINLTISSSEKIGIIGRTGAGKSSIFQALFRLTDKSTTDGQILIDGIDINNVSLCDLRSKLNIIPQTPILFSNTLRYNLDPLSQYTDDQIWNALEAVQLKTMVCELKEQFNTPMGKFGGNFSVGECQLICVARAILKQSKILLIDEATAHVDTKTDVIIQKNLREKFTNQTVLTIAHRLNTIIDSDRIAILNDGVIIELDTPDKIFTIHNDLLSEIVDDDDEDVKITYF